MNCVPKEDAERELRRHGCEIDSGPRAAVGSGAWWLTPWGTPFFLEFDEDAGAVNAETLRRLLTDLVRARPWSH